MFWYSWSTRIKKVNHVKTILQEEKEAYMNVYSNLSTLTPNHFKFLPKFFIKELDTFEA